MLLAIILILKRYQVLAIPGFKGSAANKSCKRVMWVTLTWAALKYWGFEVGGDMAGIAVWLWETSLRAHSPNAVQQGNHLVTLSSIIEPDSYHLFRRGVGIFASAYLSYQDKHARSIRLDAIV